VAVVTRNAERGQRRARLRALTWSLVIAPLTALCVALAIAFAAEVLYADRALPGVTVAGIDVGSLTRGPMVERLQNELSRPWSEGTFAATYDGRSWRTTNGALGVRPDVVAAAEAALSHGKAGSVLDRLGAWGDALRGETHVPMTLRAEGDALDRWLGSVAADVDRPAVAGSLSVGPRGLAATAPVVGRQLDRVATAASVLAAQKLEDREIALSVRAVYPDVDESGFSDALAKATAATTPLTISAEELRVAEDGAGLASLLVVDRVLAKPGELSAPPAGAIVPNARFRYTVTLDEARIAE
jgi:hypothetical protein